MLGETSAYNDVANWRYADLPAVLAPTVQAHTFVVNNESKLEAALETATDPRPDHHRNEVQADGHAKGHARLRQDGP